MVAIAALVASTTMPPGTSATAFLGFGCVLLAVVAGFAGRRVLAAHRRSVHLRTVRDVIALEPHPAYVTSLDLKVLQVNSAALGFDGVTDLHTAVAAVSAEPDMALRQMAWRAQRLGRYEYRAISDQASHCILVRKTGENLLLWTVSPVEQAAPLPAQEAVASVPVARFDGRGQLASMNEPLSALIGDDIAQAADLFPDLADLRGQIITLETADGPQDYQLSVQAHAAGGADVYCFAVPETDAAATVDFEWSEIEDLPIPLMKLSPNGEVLAVNREARDLLPTAVTADTRMSDLLEGLGRPIIDWLTDVASGRGQQTSEFLRGTGAHQDTFLQVTLNRSGRSSEPYLLAVLSDATELKSLEAQFVQSQKMQAIGQLAGGVAHDFNNLLTAISGHCDLLLLRHDAQDEDYADLIQIHQNANRAASLVGQLLAYSRKQNLMPQVIDLRDTLSDLTHLLNRLVGEKVTLVLDHEPDLKPIRADKRQLEQVLMNLVVNARDAMESGEIAVRTENIQLTEALKRDRVSVPPGDYVVVRVIDQGVGISPDKMSKIFEPFYTSKRPGAGTGLGLSTAYGIVKQTGGYIFADSEVGKGAVFSLYFPASDTPKHVEKPAPSLPSAAQSQPLCDGVILLVEDEAPVRAFASRALRMRGFVVLEADSGEAALAMLDDPDLSVDVFVSDVIMPGKDGPTWVREAMKDRPDTRVVFVSGYAEDSFPEQQAAVPHSVFLPKPFSLTELTQTVQEQMVDRVSAGIAGP